MLVRDFVEVPLPMEAVVTRVGDPATWARSLDRELDPGERTFLARFGLDGVFPSIGRMVEVRIGPPRHQQRGTVIDVQWQAAGGSAWFPVMQADVSMLGLGAAATHLEFSGNYTPPSGIPGRVADRTSTPCGAS